MKNKCLFCLISNKIVKAEIISEEKRTFSILDINPLSKGHTLIITKKHFDNLKKIDNESWNDIFVSFKKVIKILEEKYQPKGFNFISNIGKEASQTIEHIHIHVIPKYEKSKGFIWPEKNN